MGTLITTQQLTPMPPQGHPLVVQAATGEDVALLTGALSNPVCCYMSTEVQWEGEEGRTHDYDMRLDTASQTLRNLGRIILRRIP